MHVGVVSTQFSVILHDTGRVYEKHQKMVKIDGRFLR